MFNVRQGWYFPLPLLRLIHPPSDTFLSSALTSLIQYQSKSGMWILFPIHKFMAILRFNGRSVNYWASHPLKRRKVVVEIQPFFKVSSKCWGNVWIISCNRSTEESTILSLVITIYRFWIILRFHSLIIRLGLR